jgi:predicted permease
MRLKHWFYTVPLRLRSLFRRSQVEQELDEELRYHIERQIEEHISKGMTEEEARYAALGAMGGVERRKEECRDMRRVRLIEDLIQDLRYNLRTLRKRPGFMVVAVLMLALGIGANTAIFSVVNAVLLRSLPYRDPDRLVMLRYNYPQVKGFDSPSVYKLEEFLEWREQAKAFEQIAAYQPNTADLTGSGEPERLAAGYISANLFATLGVAPALGRAFTPAEETVCGAPVVILSNSLWQRRFGGDPQVIGQAITLAGQSRTVVGIMPHGFRFPGESDLWLPLELSQRFCRKEFSIQSVIARLKPRVTIEAARSDLSGILERKRQDFPREYSDKQVLMIGLSESLVGKVRLALLILFGAVVFVLLIACANVANLLLTRSAARQKEMAIRAAIGAGRLRLVRQLLTESLLLSSAGGFAGLIVAKWGIKILVAMSPVGIPRIDESGVDARVLGFTCVIVVLVGLIAGIFPALQASKIDVIETLKGPSTTRSGHSSGFRVLPALMITELALALVLLIGAGLMIKSFLRLLAVPKGFNTAGVLTLELRPSFAKYRFGSPQRIAYFQEMLARVQALPGIQSASLTGFLPLTESVAGIGRRQLIEGRPPFEPGKEPSIYATHISSDYFRTMGIPIRTGRPFDRQDANAALKVVIINESMAQRFFPNENPIGHRLLITSSPPPHTIVGVVGDTRNFGLDQEAEPEIFLPYPQNTGWSSDWKMSLVMRAPPDQNSPASLSVMATNIRNQLRAIDPNEPVNQIVTLEESLSNSVAQRRFQMFLLGIFASVALLIAMVGIYGVISYAVSQRTHEIGIRMALGAQSRDVLRMVIWRGLSLALIGVTLGLAAALALTRVIKNLLFEVSTTDPVTFVIIVLLLVVAAMIASYIPARRATKVDPLLAIRNE